MKPEEDYKEQYKVKKTPWDIGRPDFNLIEIVKRYEIKKCKSIDIGCGTGDNTIWLAERGFTTFSIDTSDIALKTANEKSLNIGLSCRFVNLNIFKDDITEAPFGFAFDRGCFHSFKPEEEKKLFAAKVASILDKNGLWLTLAGNADEIRETPGPIQISAKEIILASELYFEIILLESTHFDSNVENPPRAWRCLMRKRS